METTLKQLDRTSAELIRVLPDLIKTGFGQIKDTASSTKEVIGTASSQTLSYSLDLYHRFLDYSNLINWVYLISSIILSLCIIYLIKILWLKRKEVHTDDMFEYSLGIFFLVILSIIVHISTFYFIDNLIKIHYIPEVYVIDKLQTISYE